MNIARFEPWTMLDMLHRDLDRLVGQRALRGNGESTVAEWVPAVDVIEDKERFLLRADVPGVRSEDIDISMDGGVLSVSGDRHAEARTEESGLQRIERSTGHFFRRFTLPETADADSVSARCKDGVLEVSIPKKPEVQARRIAVENA